MRVTDHTYHQSSWNMYCKHGQSDQTDLRQPDNTSTKSNNQVPDSTDKSTGKDEKTTGRKENSPVADRFETYAQKSEDPGGSIKQLQRKEEATKKSYETGRHSTLYSSTADLMAIANTENQEVLRAIYIRLSFKLWSVRAAGVTNTNRKAISKATRSIEKVMGKVKGKIKNLQKEDEMEKKAEAARKAKLRRLQQELRRELAIKRKIRRNKERKDVADSYLESDGQYSVKSCRDSLPEEVQLQMELQRAGATGAVMSDASIAAMDATMAIDSTVVSMSAEAAISSVAADAGGAFVDLAL